LTGSAVSDEFAAWLSGLHFSLPKLFLLQLYSDCALHSLIVQMTSFRGGYTLGSADNARSPRLPNGPSTAWDSALSAEDKKAYAQFFKFADEENKGFITGDEAVKFFARSGVPNQILAEVGTIY
jgi:hypothetical protein